MSPQVGTSSVQGRVCAGQKLSVLNYVTRYYVLYELTLLSTWTSPFSITRTTTALTTMTHLLAVMVATGKEIATHLDEMTKYFEKHVHNTNSC